MQIDILAYNGLSETVLRKLSYHSELGISLKKNLHYFEKIAVMSEMERYTEWLYRQDILDDIALDYRIKSLQSISKKFDRYYPDKQMRKVFNDILGFRAFCDSYKQVLELENELYRVADMSYGKSNDDGYRGVHLYYQVDNSYYPIEIQFNTLFDRQLNNWLHDYIYKKCYPLKVGKQLREQYELGKIRTEEDFKEILKCVIS